MDLNNGEFLINDIKISYKDSLTSFLEKTIFLEKRIENINNYQHLYIKNIIFNECEIKINSYFIFDPEGKFIFLELSSSAFTREDYLSFLKKINCEEKNYFFWGSIELGEYKLFSIPVIAINIK